jgi:RNA polymerase sigma-70 factor, ECF subfamily
VGLAPDAGRSGSRPLAELAAHGDRDAFAQIVAENDADMFRLSVLITGDADVARDAVQQAWSHAWRSLGSLRDETRLRSWLLSIAANEARAVVRAERRLAARQDAFAAGLPTRPKQQEPNFELEEALARLSRDDRAILALRYLFGFNAREIANLLHSTHGAIRSRLTRVLRVLRAELGDE